MRRSLAPHAVSVLTIVALLGAAPSASAAFPDSPDPAFGTGGRVLASVGNHVTTGSDLLLDSAGRAVVVGGDQTLVGNVSRFFIGRFTSAGAPDQGFGGGSGLVTTDLGGAAFAEAVVQQADGKYLVAGSAASKLTLVRYNGDGSPDLSYNGTGHVTVAPTPGILRNVTAGIVLDPVSGDAIVLSNVTEIATGRVRAVLQVISVDGAMVGSPKYVDIGSDGTRPAALALRGTSLVIAATGIYGAEVHQVVAKLKLAGFTADTSFGGDGMTGAGGDPEEATAVAIQADGSVLVAGTTGDHLRPAITRFTPTGLVDHSFADNSAATGTVGTAYPELVDQVTPLSPPKVDITGVVVRPDGRILLSGYADSSPDMLVVGLTPTGALDPGFAPGGVVDVLGAGYGSDIALDSLGRPIVSSTVPAAGNKSRMGLTRLTGGGGPARMSSPPHATLSADGITVTCDPGGWPAGTSFTYRWKVGSAYKKGNGLESTQVYGASLADHGMPATCEVIGRSSDGLLESGIAAADNTVVPGTITPTPVTPGPVTPDPNATTDGPPASVAASDVPATTPAATAAEVLRQCSGGRLAVLDVVRFGARARVSGQARPSDRGTVVPIVLRPKAGSRLRVVGRATVTASGSFTALVPLPAKALRATAAYGSRIGATTSRLVKLQRRLLITQVASVDRRVTVRGAVLGARAGRPVVLTVQTGCDKRTRVTSVRPAADGTFEMTATAPAGAAVAIYRAETVVPQRTGRPVTSQTYTLPRPVDVG